MKKILICILLILIQYPCVAAPLDKAAFDTISISADEATEDEQPGILHLKGDFSMRSTDWNLNSDLATVYGSPNNPDRIYLQGSPAHFSVTPAGNTDKGVIEATALTVEYIRDGNRLILSGGATLILGDEVIQSININYDIDSNRYQASGRDGVYIKVPPINKR